MIYKIIILIFLILITMLFSSNKGGIDLKQFDQAPLFTAFNHLNEEISLQDYLGNYVVLYFFPKSFTPGWTKQACGFRDKYSIYKDNNTVVLGISYDTPKKLNKFKEKHNLPFTFISDRDKTVSKLYNSGGFFFPSRKTFIISPKGEIIKIIESINIDSHAKNIINIILNDQNKEVQD